MSDRELDALVAEKVMGCKPRLSAGGTYYRCGCSDEESPEGHDAIIKQGAIGIFGAPIRLPYYSTNIAEAWNVIDKIVGGKDSVKFELERLTYGPAPGRWWVFLYRDTMRFSGFSDDAPRAICLAALKFVGIDVASQMGK